MGGSSFKTGLFIAAFIAPIAVAHAGDADHSGEKINWDRIDLAKERSAIEGYQKYDQLLQNVGWKLARANVDFCDTIIPSIGLQMQDMASYGSPQIAQRALGLAGQFAVQTAASGSPAALSGAFANNREIALIEDQNPSTWEAGTRFEWQRLARAHDFVDVTLAQNGSVNFTFADGAATPTTISVSPVSVCATRFELLGDGDTAVANGDRVVIGIEFPAFQYAEAEFAGLVAHELAHNLLRHTAWLDRNGRKRRNIRVTEREADRLIPWLLANAGYDPRAGQRFFEKWGPGNDGGLFRNRSHDGWDERAEFVEAEIAQIEALIASEGKADWRRHFARDIDPNKGL